jgi:hypothetical protein
MIPENWWLVHKHQPSEQGNHSVVSRVRIAFLLSGTVSVSESNIDAQPDGQFSRILYTISVHFNNSSSSKTYMELASTNTITDRHKHSRVFMIVPFMG